jgi:hypothetical protein
MLRAVKQAPRPFGRIAPVSRGDPGDCILRHVLGQGGVAVERAAQEGRQFGMKILEEEPGKIVLARGAAPEAGSAESARACDRSSSGKV